jgi:bifunctional N-acetylglucosamine-1-phosphate-uridyltransferase/glucosamine-1-phosphate-acetyltransferase GlmU-like protein
MSRQAPLAFIMAAGLGTRMKSDTAKVLHKVAGRPMLHWVVTAARTAGAARVVAILGHQIEQVKASSRQRSPAASIPHIKRSNAVRATPYSARYPRSRTSPTIASS